MNAIASPPAIYVEYKSLSNNPEILEIQKDILVQFIKANKHENSLVVENTDNINEVINKNTVLSIKCISCQINNSNLYEIIPNSIRKIKNNFVTEYRFDLKNSIEQKFSWHIEIMEKKNIYYIVAKQTINPNMIIFEKDLEILRCTSGENKCTPKYPFIELKEAQKQLNFYNNKKTSQFLSIKQEIEPKSLSQEILVRTGEIVKIIYSPKDSLVLQTMGKSLSNGGRGELIRVQLTDWHDKGFVPHSTKRIIEGIVIAPSEVEYAAN